MTEATTGEHRRQQEAAGETSPNPKRGEALEARDGESLATAPSMSVVAPGVRVGEFPGEEEAETGWAEEEEEDDGATRTAAECRRPARLED